MKLIRLTYEPEADILYITFGQPTAATGYQLSDQILLRVDPETQRVAGLTILNFSVHTEADREIPLSGLEEDPEMKPFLLHLLSASPVAHFLRVVEGDQGVSAMLLRPSLQEVLVG